MYFPFTHEMVLEIISKNKLVRENAVKITLESLTIV